METTAKEIMSQELLTFPEGGSVEDALKVLINNKITGIPVVNTKNKMVGVLSEYDLLDQLAKKGNLTLSDFKAEAQFTPKVYSLSEDTPLKEIVKIFVDSKYRRLPIVNSENELVGIITRRDLMRVFYYRTKLT